MSDETPSPEAEETNEAVANQVILREAPISLDQIADTYIVYFSESLSFTFNFADPLAEKINNGEIDVEQAGNALPEGLDVKLVSNDLIPAV